MAGLALILDTNAISDYINGIEPTTTRMDEMLAADERLIIVQPAYYEARRGMLKVGAARKLTVFDDVLIPQLLWEPTITEDWDQAADYWVTATSKGRQLSDMDLLIAAITTRLDGVLVSADADFDALDIPRENWRES